MLLLGPYLNLVSVTENTTIELPQAPQEQEIGALFKYFH